LLAAASAPIGCGLSPEARGGRRPIFTPVFPGSACAPTARSAALASVGPDALSISDPAGRGAEAKSIAPMRDRAETARFGDA
jgi:hypothetical protein